MSSAQHGDGAYVVSLVRELVRINSVNPVFVERRGGVGGGGLGGVGGAGGVGGPGGEGAIAAYVASVGRRMGVATQVHECAPGRTSVVGVVRGSGGGRSVMLNGHLDTVGFGGMRSPMEGRIEGGRLYGRGAYDMKGSVAACIAAVKRLVDSRTRLRGDVVLALVADEEDASLGTADIAARYPVDGAIVTEPTGGKLAMAHRGFCWMRVTTHGFACHGSRFDLGVDANMMMGKVLGRLAGLEREVRSRRAGSLAGPSSLHAPMLSGGVGPSVYSPSCELQIEWRMAPGETAEGAVGEVRRMVEGLAREDPAFRAEVAHVQSRGSFEAMEGSGVAAAVARAAIGVHGEEPERVGVPYWTDAAILRDAGADVVVYGCDGAGAHEDEEWVDLESVKRLVDVLAGAVALYCA